MTEWFEEWFGEEYLRLYPHRDDVDAERLVRLIVDAVRPPPGARVLDVACGAGRHARAFRQLGLSTVGVDLSRALLARARAVAGVPVIRADMRALPARPRAFDVTVNLFTSFGYFACESDHERALCEMIGTVKPGGWFVLDFLNAALVRQTLVRRETTVLAGSPVTVERRLEDGDRYVVKTITTPDGRRFQERVRLYESGELQSMIGRAGAQVRRQFGSYEGDDPDAGSPRTILLARTA